MTPTPPYKVAELTSEAMKLATEWVCAESAFALSTDPPAVCINRARSAHDALESFIRNALSASPALAPTDEAALRQFAEALIAVEPIVHYDAAPKGWNVHMADVAFDKYDAALAFARALLSRSPKVDTGTPSGDQNRGGA